MEKPLSEFTVTELKAIAYDQMAQIELSQRNLQTINQELSKRMPPPVQKIEPLPPGSIHST